MRQKKKNKNKNKSIILLSGEKAPKKDKNAFAIERISLLQVHFSHFIAKQGTISKDICFKQGTQFSSAGSNSGLIYYGPAN